METRRLKVNDSDTRLNTALAFTEEPKPTAQPGLPPRRPRVHRAQRGQAPGVSASPRRGERSRRSAFSHTWAERAKRGESRVRCSRRFSVKSLQQINEAFRCRTWPDCHLNGVYFSAGRDRTRCSTCGHKSV